MKHVFWIGLAAAAGLVMSAAAPADNPSGAPVKDWSNVETVIVTAKVPGPALWHIVKGNSEVWILPTVSPMPKSLAWDTGQVAFAMKGAKALLTPPHGSVGVFEGLWFWMTAMDTLEQPDGVTLESTLADPLKSRFVAARNANHRDADRYDKYLPAVAAVILENDFRNTSDLVIDQPRKAVESIASRLAVPVRPVATYPAIDVVHDVPKMSPAAQRACLEDALADIDTQRAHARAAAEAWAVGDLDGVKAHYSEVRLDTCFQANAAYAALRERAIADTTNAVFAALAKPGKTVMLVPMGLFLRNKSVLDRLVASGATVTGPGS